MLLGKQVLVGLWTIVWVITVDGAFIRKSKDVIKEYSSMVVDASPNAMQIVARNAMVRDKTVGGFANDVTSQSEEDDFPNDRRVRRQAESTEMVDMEQEPEMEEIQGIWQGMWQTMVEGAKKIVQKFAGSLDHAPGQAGNEN